MFAGVGTMFDPNKQPISFARIRDGIANTIMVVEANDAVPWTKPEELPFPPKGQRAPAEVRKDKRSF